MAEVDYKRLLEASPHLFAKDVYGLRMSDAHIKMMDHISGDQNRSLLLCQRGLGKSMIIQAYITWRALKNPDERIILVSSTDTKSTSFVRAIKTTLMSEKVKEIWGDVKGDVWSDHEIILKGRTKIYAEPTILALGAGSGACVGKHCTICAVDDLVDFDSTRSELQRDRTRDWFLTALLPTLMADASIIAAGTRYHFTDVYNLLINKLNYDTLILPPVKPDGNAQCEWLQPMDDVISSKGMVIKRGLNSIKKDLGSVIYALQYANDVNLLMEGNIVDRHWIQYYETLPELHDVVISCDPAISKSDSADYTAIIVGGRADNDKIYIRDYVNRRMSFKETLTCLEGLVKKYNPEQVRIEMVGFSEAFITEMKTLTSATFINGIKPKGDKESRLREVTPIMENMLLYFAHNQNEIVDQLLLFNDGDHDDLVDAMSLFLGYYKTPPEGVVIW